MSQLRTFWTEPPTHIRVYPCPQCQETISINASSCRFCHVPVDLKVAEQLWARNQQLRTETQQVGTAIARANAYSVFSRAAMVVTAFTLLRTFALGSLGEIWIICQLLAISYGAQWLNHNSSLVTDDEDFVAAVSKVNRAIVGWAVLLLAQVAAYFFVNGVPDWNAILDLFLVE